MDMDLYPSELRWQPEAIKARERNEPSIRFVEGHIGDPKLRVWFWFWIFLLWTAFKAFLRGTIPYSHAMGNKRLRKAVVKQFAQEGISIGADQVFISNGSSEAIETVMALRFRGKKILVNRWFYPNYVGMAAMAGVELVKYEDLDEAAKLLEDDNDITGWIVNDPHNPSGKLLSREETRRIVSIVEKHELHVIADEAYSTIVFAEEFVTLAHFLNWEQITVVRSASKDLGMPGIRVAWLVMEGPPEQLASKGPLTHPWECMFSLAARRLGPVAEFIQEAIALYLEYGSRRIRWQRQWYQDSRDALRNALINSRFKEMFVPEGAFYLQIIHPDIENGRKFTEWLIGEFQLNGWTCTITPLGDTDDGAVFRIAYVANKEGCARLGRILCAAEAKYLSSR